MAEFVTKKENGRRLAIIILCVIADAVALAVGIYALKNANDLEKKEKDPDNILKLRPRVADQRQRNQALHDNMLQFGPPIGWNIQAISTTHRFPTTGAAGSASYSARDAETVKKLYASVDYDAMQAFLNGWADELKNQYKIEKYSKWGPGGDPTKTLHLTELFDDLLAKEKEYITKIKDLETNIDTERKEEKKQAEETEKEAKDVQDRIDGGVSASQDAAGLIGELKKGMKDYNALIKQQEAEIGTLEVETVTKQTEATNLKNENLRKTAAYEATKTDLKRRIYTIQHVREEARERRDPDGKILAVNLERQLVYINLLHKDRLFKGTRFTVFSLERGGQKLDKGTIEVIEVRDAVSSICAVIKTIDPDWPLKTGDFIYNEMYEGGKQRHIAFAGRFTGKLSNEEAAAVIRNFGDVYQPRVDEKTNYLVLGEGYEEHPNFAAAREYGVKIMLEKYLYDYLGVK